MKVNILILSGLTFDHRYNQGSGDIGAPWVHPVRLKKNLCDKNVIKH